MLTYLERIPRRLLVIFAAVSPTLVLLLLIGFQANISNFQPTWNDSVMNYHQIATFHKVGFDGGYYTYAEIPAPASFTHFFSYGPWFSMLYGLPARITGWSYVTFLIFNVIFFTTSLLIFFTLVPLDRVQILVVALFLSTFWCLIFFYFTAMQEAVQQSLAVLMAAFFYIALTQRHNTSRRTIIAGMLIITFASLLRLSWIILALPFLVLTSLYTLKRLFLNLVITGLLLLLIMKITAYTTASGATVAPLAGLSRMPFGLEMLRTLVFSFENNIKDFFGFGITPNELLAAYQYIIILVAIFIITIRLRRQYVGKKLTSHRVEWLFHAFNLGVIWLASMLLYLVSGWGTYRVLGSHLMISMLLFIAFKRYRLVQFFVITNLLMLPLFIQAFNTYVMPMYDLQRSSVRLEQVEWVDDVNPYLAYDPQAVSPWCNTILMAVRFYDGRLNVLPAGIGISLFSNDRQLWSPITSHYLLLDEGDLIEVMRQKFPPKLEKLVETQRGTLYKNLSAGCDVLDNS